MTRRAIDFPAMNWRPTLIAISAFVLVASGCSPSGGAPRWDWWNAGKQSSHEEMLAEEESPEAIHGAAAQAPARPAPPAPPPRDQPVDPPVEDAPVAAVAHKETPQRKKPSPGAIQPDVLLINNEPIRVIDILEPLNPRLEQLSRELPPRSYYQRAAQLVKGQIVEAVAQQLIWRRASEHVTDDLKPAIDKALDKVEKERINREFDGRETSYEKYIAKQGRTREEVRERLRRTVIIDSYLRERLLPLVPAPRRDELLSYYNANKKEYEQPERRELFLIDLPVAEFVETRNIFGPSREENDAAWSRAREVAASARDAVLRGESFEEVARQYSRGPKRDEGGAWGLITRPADPGEAPLQGRWEKPSRRLFQLGEGQVSEVIEDAESQSLFIVKCGRVEGGGVISFKDAQPDIIETLRQQRFVKLRADFLQAELEKSTIGSLDDFMIMVMDAIPSPGGRSAGIAAP
ncbi:MAG: hypothetical protein DCC65_04985 [Planctomycetota bacterium]|nr:MAG: hypothetical protein DCC65_04985 [Planctomycetota bacterium]